MVKLLIIFILTIFRIEAFDHKLSVLTIFRDEEPYLKEWIDYHLSIGVDHFLLFDHMSKDKSLEVLKPYINKGIVEVVLWPHPEWPKAQLDAMKIGIDLLKNKSQWVACIDTDEFIFCHEGDLKKFLREFLPYASLSINWQIFGTGGIYELKNGETLIDKLLYRAQSNFNDPTWNSNYYVKSIIQPQLINELSTNPNCGNHVFEPKSSFLAVNENHEVIQLSPLCHKVSVSRIQLNHYWFRTEKFFRETKLNRRNSVGEQYTEEKIQKIIKATNEIYDDRIIRKFHGKVL